MHARAIASHAARHLHAAAENPAQADETAQPAGEAFSQLLNGSAKTQWKQHVTALRSAADSNASDAESKLKTKADDLATPPANPAALAQQQAAAQAQANGNTANGGAAGAANGAANGSPVPPGVDDGQADPLSADEVQARVALGAPTYLSQPSAALAGLWHRAAPAGDATPADPNATASASAADAANENATDQKTADAAATAGKATVAAAEQHAARTDADGSAGQAVGAPDATAAGTASDSGAASGAATAGPSTFALPQSASPAQTASAAAPTLAPPQLPNFAPAAEQVALSLKQAVQDGTDRIEIQLKPASLGAIEVKLNVAHDGHVTAVVSADRSDTLNVLRQDASGLQQALRDAGLQTDNGSLSFNLRGDAQSFAQNSNPNPSSAGFASSASATTAAAALPRFRYHGGSVDIEV